MKDIGRPTHHRVRGPGRLATLLMTVTVMLGLSGGAAFAATDRDRKPSRPAVWVPDCPMDAVARMQPSWNLGNTLDAIPNETSWGNALTTKALFDRIKAEGFRSVRIPVTWYTHQSATAPYTIDPVYMKRVKQVVDLALADGLYVEINVHHDSWQWIANISTDHDNVLARFDATWKQIATAFKDEPRKLLMESVNEPSFGTATDAQKTQYMKELNTSFHSIVRKSGGKNADRLLVLPTQGCTPSQTLMDELATTISSLHDRNLVATVHFYGYWPFSVNIAGVTTYDAATRKDMADFFARMRDIFTSKNIPVYLGEYGLLSEPTSGYVERGEMLKYYEELGYLARASKVTSALWDDANFLNRAALQWRDPGLMAQIKSSWTTRSGTTSSDNVFVPKSGPVTDQTLTLNLNGTKFLGIWKGNTPLSDTSDYSVKGDQVTLSTRLLTRLAADRAYGVNSTLELWFSEGATWNVNVNTYDAPVLSDATGTTAAFSVPTQFRGDKLATMEAKYADGTNAGTATWTPYQAFGYNFAPDYSTNATNFTPAFLESLKDGETATLTFHYWSGGTATYHVTRSGTAVTGTAS